MTEDVLLIAGVLLLTAACAWYVVHAIGGVVLPVPDEMCASAAECLALAMGQ